MRRRCYDVVKSVDEELLSQLQLGDAPMTAGDLYIEAGQLSPTT